ncbi:uncharacterized protein LOC122511569 isoform X1 [Leptopilina heterotoma]|uniref:uncharacterized protein LOC122511569 isoform X1 n=2 Tax=Leptopilina heterotoma TaxID=63436 RepID=UPI001CA9FA5D|nr:uncharacterized protein LOC122511569 isoform X1 [Leptopilina heterotoma]
MEDKNQDTCYSPGSIAGAVIGTFLTTILLFAVAALFYRQWRRHKGKHLVLVTDPEIVDDAYAFDNPCFKDATPAVARSLERPISATPMDTPAKDSTRWSTPWSSLGLGNGNRNDKRRTLDDSCLGPKATKVSCVSLRSRDFTGLGFNVCGNMREGIFVKDLLHRGPASESGRIHPGDRITSVKISFRSMVYEDALTILSYASPYDVELEVESGGTGSKPTTLLKKSVGPSPTRICHPLYRSQSIPELSRAHITVAKRLFIADPNESLGSNYSTMNSTLKSSKSTPGSQTLERRHEETKQNHHKFGIKVLPALDGTVHRIENQNEHNTNLERRHSRKMDAEKILGKTSSSLVKESSSPCDEIKIVSETLQQKENPLQKDISIKNDNSQPKDKNSLQMDLINHKETVEITKRILRVDGTELNGIDIPDLGKEINMSTQVPAEVHNAAMAARRNRKNSAELSKIPKSPTISIEIETDAKSPQKNKRKAPAPPKINLEELDVTSIKKERESEDKIDSIADYTESLNDYVSKVRENKDDEARRQRLEARANRRNSESDTDSEVQNSFTTIELNPADITIHHTPVPEVDDDEVDDIYRKAASLGDLSKYENKTSTNLERAQSLDMTDTGSKKRKAPLPPEDINESTEDLTKLDQIDTFDKRKLKKSSEWGTLEDAIWSKGEIEDKSKKTRVRKKSNGTLERSKSAVEMKIKDEVQDTDDPVNVSDGAIATTIDLYNLPLSKRMSQDFIHSERMFNPDADNSLARIVNNGRVVKSPTPEEVELDFRQAKPMPDDIDDANPFNDLEDRDIDKDNKFVNEGFEKALHYFDLHTKNSNPSKEFVSFEESKEKDLFNSDPKLLYKNEEPVEEIFTKVKIDYFCPGCEKRFGHHTDNCKRNTFTTNGKRTDDHLELQKAEIESDQVNHVLEDLKNSKNESETYPDSHVQKPEKFQATRDEEEETPVVSIFQTHLTKFEQNSSPDKSDSYETHFAKRIVNLPEEKDVEMILDDQDEDGYDFGSSITVNNKNISPNEDRHNISNVSVSSGENSEDSGLVRESIDFRLDSETRPPLPTTPMPVSATQKMTYITEIKVSPTRENIHEPDSESEEIVAIMEGNGEARKSQVDIIVTANGKPTPGKKPPVPPRRSDVSKLIKDEISDKQVVYVSEYKSPSTKDVQISSSASDDKTAGVNKKFEQWIFLGDNKEQNPWGNGSSPPQPVTNIVLSSGDEKILHQ